MIGAGGHAHVVVEALMHPGRGDSEVVGLLDDDPALHRRRVVGVEVLGPIDQLACITHDAVVVAIGNNAVRRRIFSDLERQRERFANAWHCSAVIAAEVETGRNVMMSAGAIVNVASVIGANVILNTSCTIDHHCVVGDHVHVGPGAHLGGHVTVAEGAFVGLGAVVLPGRRIGAWSTVGAGSVVTRDVASGVTVVGVPARVIGKRAPVIRR